MYERLTVRGKPPTFFTLIVTQLVSGIWHGLFPGYVLFFISSALMFQSSKVLYRYERNWPKQVQSFPLWVLAKWAYTAFCLNYCARAFMVSSWGVSCLVLQLECKFGVSAFSLAWLCMYYLCSLLYRSTGHCMSSLQVNNNVQLMYVCHPAPYIDMYAHTVSELCCNADFDLQ